MESCFFSSSPWGFRFLSTEEYCRTLKGIGIDRLCFMLGPDDGFPQALKGGSAQGGYYRDLFASNGVFALEAAMMLDGTADDVRMIAAVGAEYLRICEVWEHTEEEFRRVSVKLKELGRRAGDLGLKVVVENHGGLMATSEDCLRLFEAVGESNVALNYDAANFMHYGGEDPLSALKAVRAIVGFTHLKSVSESGLRRGSFCRISRGVLDYPAIMRELGSFYHGCLCLEYERPDDVLSGTKDDLEALKSILEKAG